MLFALTPTVAFASDGEPAEGIILTAAVSNEEGKSLTIVNCRTSVNVRKGAVHYTYKVLAPLEKRQGAKEVERFAQNLTPESELVKLKAPVETFFIKRDRGMGRPTKKDRREMDELYSSFFVDDDGDDE